MTQSPKRRLEKIGIAIGLAVPAVATCALTLFLAIHPITVDATHLVPGWLAGWGVLSMALTTLVAIWAGLRLAVNTQVAEGVLQRTESRLSAELHSVKRTGTICLIMGSSIAAAGVGMAFFLNANREPIGKDIQEQFKSFLMSLGPRFAIVIFIELLAYFFLRMYRQTFDQLRFYHAELSSIELKIKALDVAKSLGATANAPLEKVIVTLANERRQKTETPEFAANHEIDSAIKLLEALRKVKSSKE